MDDETLWTGDITDVNKGGVIVSFGHLRGFVPASHVVDLPRGLKEEERLAHMRGLVGNTITVKVIEVNQKRRRLVFSQLEAEQESRAARKEALLQELEEGSSRNGVVSGLCDFGAFVDLGGADGLIHISELAWRRVRHPSQVLAVGDEVNVYILNLDKKGQRIGLSLKRLQPNPWTLVDGIYHIGQLVEGVISRLESFGAFISMDPGIEALLHISQMSANPDENPLRHLYEGQKLLMRIISIESDRQRLGLSLTEVTAAEKASWEARQLELVAAAAEAARQEEEAAELDAQVAEPVAPSIISCTIFVPLARGIRKFERQEVGHGFGPIKARRKSRTIVAPISQTRDQRRHLEHGTAQTLAYLQERAAAHRKEKGDPPVAPAPTQNVKAPARFRLVQALRRLQSPEIDFRLGKGSLPQPSAL